MITCSVFKRVGTDGCGCDILESVTKGGCAGTGKRYLFASIGGTPAYIGPQEGNDTDIISEVRT